MDMDELLDEAIRNGFDEILTLPAGSEDRSSAVDDLAKLYKLRLDEEKISAEKQARMDQNESEDTCKRATLAEEKKSRWLKFGTDVAGIVIPTAVYIMLAAWGFEFEKTGSISSLMFRNIIGKLRPGK